MIDCTEFGIECPSSLVTQATTFSSYKNKNTVKVLIGIISSGAVIFVSPTYEGSVSDKKLVEQSGLLDKIEVGNKIIADKGFDIQDSLAPLEVKLNIPTTLSSNSQFSSEDVIHTKKIVKLRIHVERAMWRIKEFRILQLISNFVPSCGTPSMKSYMCVPCCVISVLLFVNHMFL